MKKTIIGIAGNKTTTLELINDLEEARISVDYLIHLTPLMATDAAVSQYLDLRETAQARGIKVYHPKTYSLKSEEDRQNITDLRIELLFVMGWQRLIPNWFLTQLKYGAYGMHGSSFPLPEGRGRSPMNWSLVEGRTEFVTHLFKYEPGIDDGMIVGYQWFDINGWDTCETLHFKNRIAMSRLIKENLDKIINEEVSLQSQVDRPPSYYHKRTWKDGIIPWEHSTMQIYNRVRAVTNPFPGAFTFDVDGGNKVMIWDAQPFDTRLCYDAVPGSIVEVLYNEQFVVKTGSDSLLVTSWTGKNWRPLKNKQFFTPPDFIPFLNRRGLHDLPG